MFLSKLFARRESRRDDTLPTICYPACQDAQTEAQSSGKYPGMCDEGTPFRTAYDICSNCIIYNTNNTAAVLSTFSEYFDYCEFANVQLITITGTAVFAGRTMPLTFTTQVTYNATGTSTSSANTTVFSSSTSTPLTSANLTASASPTITTDSNLIPSAEPTASTNLYSGSKAWMAGPVVGSISGVAILAFGVFLWYRRRTAKSKPHSEDLTDKPQLHSDCVPRPPPDELDAGMRHELPGDEGRDQKAAMSELPSKDPRLQDRTYGMSELP